jgi:hypothetical protein
MKLGTETMTNPKDIVESIHQEIENARGTHIWNDYVNALRLISQVVFTRSSGFILELIQNAEDAGQGQSEVGSLEIYLNGHRVKISHNGRPFDVNDVKAISGIRSSKKPEKGFLGYLGIGFKSVLKVSDRPEIYSNGFRFKFDRTYWPDPNSTPWHVIPIWLDQPSEAIDETKTTFIIPFRDGTEVEQIISEIKKLRLELYLFLRWLRKITIIDEISGQQWTLENMGENHDGITTLNSGTEQRRFKFFRRQISVSDWVKADRLTQEYRSNVTQREIAIGFALDRDGNLAPDEAGAMYGGVYSFLPLGEAKSGAKFPIQADFLVQPGRDSINYEAPWNQWLLREVTSVCIQAINSFREHEVWKYQFLPAFEFAHSKGLEAFEKLFYPELIKPIEEHLKSTPCALTHDNQWEKIDQLVRIAEDEKALNDLAESGLFTIDQIAPAFGGQTGLKVVHKKTRDFKNGSIKRADRWTLLENSEFLQAKAKETNAGEWYQKFYLWLESHPIYEEYFRYKTRRRIKGYHNLEFILTSQGELKRGGHVYMPDLSLDNPAIKELAEVLQSNKPIIHPAVFSDNNEKEKLEKLKGFLTGLVGCQLLNAKAVCMEVVLPSITTNSPQLQKDELLRRTKLSKDILGSDLGHNIELWVLTKTGAIKPSREVLLSTEFRPLKNWETHSSYVPGLNFVSSSYLPDSPTEEELRTWRDFFKATGVKDNPDNGVEEFAVNFTLEKLKCKYQNFQRVEKRNYGFDIQAETPEGSPIQIEVKGLSEDKNVELTGNEADAADRYKKSFYLCVVASIPNSPTIHLVNDPASVGKKDKLAVPVDVWRVAEGI